MELQIIQRPLFFEAVGRELARELNKASRFTHMRHLFGHGLHGFLGFSLVQAKQNP